MFPFKSTTSLYSLQMYLYHFPTCCYKSRRCGKTPQPSIRTNKVTPTENLQVAAGRTYDKIYQNSFTLFPESLPLNKHKKKTQQISHRKGQVHFYEVVLCL